ncbi:hypothetical protein [Paracoccus contaminans]|uniref:Uncharacterized protein n=1 Tax=Paracoccus contaminans TaxID=1945662 RepID=A0A1W6CW63_9RHOB|nr:hypothetical protein [Paracoccus contaminans]ARJ69091.1 hypothetical protein B0A89_05080 [Paracoccus contaminans]
MSNPDPSRPASPPGPTAAQQREAIARSHEPDDIHGSEIAAAPLGTDAEAGSTGPASAAQRAHAEAMIRQNAPEASSGTAGKPDPAAKG